MKGGESTCFRPLSGSYISQSIKQRTNERRNQGFRPLSGSYISQLMAAGFKDTKGKPFPSPIGELHFSMIKCLMHSIIPVLVSVPYRGATFLNGSTPQGLFLRRSRFRPLSGSYISQYHPRNPMSCLGRIGGLRGKSNFIEMQPFWKVKNSHKSNI